MACVTQFQGEYTVMALPDSTPNVNQPASASADAPASAATGAMQGYCVKCKATRQMTEVQIVTTQNGRKAAKGKCPACGTTVMKFLPK